MLDAIILIELIIFGIGIAFLTSMVGLGGGVLFIPLLILFFKIPPEQAVGTSIFCMTMNTFSSTIGWWRQGKVDWRLSLAYDVFDIPGIIVGAYLTTIIPSIILEFVCGIAIVSMAIIVIFKKKDEETETQENTSNDEHKESDDENKEYDVSLAWKGKNLKWVILSSFFGGLVTGMVGLGGGTVDTTTMILLGVPMKIAAGSSHFAMLLTNLVGLTTHAFLGNVNWPYALAMGIPAFIGAQLGTHFSKRVKGKILRRALGFVALYTGIRLLI